MNDHQQCKRTYDRDGFVVVRQFLTPQELAELQRNLDRYFREIVPTLPDSHAFYQERGKPETLKQMQFMEKVDEVASARHNASVRAQHEKLGLKVS